MNRSTELRAKSRRIFGWSFAVAAVAHALVIGFASWKTAAAEERAPEVAQPSSTQWTGAPVDIFFGPPRIFLPDGSLSAEPPDRILEAARSIHTPLACADRAARSVRTPGSGLTRLKVDSSGRIESVELERSTGSTCWDAVARRVAADLRYEWLPDDRFPAPVELLQPITVSWAFEAR